MRTHTQTYCLLDPPLGHQHKSPRRAFLCMRGQSLSVRVSLLVRRIDFLHFSHTHIGVSEWEKKKFPNALAGLTHNYTSGAAAAKCADVVWNAGVKWSNINHVTAPSTFLIKPAAARPERKHFGVVQIGWTFMFCYSESAYPTRRAFLFSESPKALTSFIIRKKLVLMRRSSISSKINNNLHFSLTKRFLLLDRTTARS